MKILANDGISEQGIKLLSNAGFEVITTRVAQEQVANYINKNGIAILLVRSATKVTAEIIEKCASLKMIGRGGVGMDNIDLEAASANGIKVINTPFASSESVAELVFAHLFSGARFLHDANRTMPLEGDFNFDMLKKSYANGIELRGKTLGIIGFGKIGKAVAKIGLGVGMRVIATDKFVGSAEIKVDFYNGQFIHVDIVTEPIEDVLRESDFISLHLPSQNDYVIGEAEFAMMKDGVGIINASRGDVMNEVTLIDALESGKVLFAGLDVFEGEPTPSVQLLMHPKISLSPHIGAATIEAQNRIGTELAMQIIDTYNLKET